MSLKTFIQYLQKHIFVQATLLFFSPSPSKKASDVGGVLLNPYKKFYINLNGFFSNFSLHI